MDNSPSLRQLTAKKAFIEKAEFRIEAVGLLFAVLVLAGVIGEAYAERIKVVHMASLLVSYGVAGEVVISTSILIISRASKRVQCQLDDVTASLAETHRIELEQHIGGLKSQLAKANATLDEQRPRRLTNEQVAAIAKAVAPFTGTRIVVRYRMAGTDDAAFAQDFVFAFHGAGLDCTQVESSTDMSNFENVIICISKEDAIPNYYPEFMLALSCTLANLGLTSDPNLHTIAADLKKGEFRLWIGAGPRRRPSIPNPPFRVFKLPPEADGTEIRGIIPGPFLDQLEAMLPSGRRLPTDLSSIVPLPPPLQTPT